MRAHGRPQLYLRGETYWIYWRAKRWSAHTSDRAEAQRVADAAYSRDATPSQERVLADAILLLYEALERRGRSPVTQKQAREKLGHYARLWGEHKRLSLIDWPLMSEYIKTRLEVDKAARVTVSHEIGYLRQAWKLARASGWCTRAWDEVMPERFDRRYIPRTRWLTAQELDGVLSSLPDARAALLAWIVATGSDLGDVARAQPGDLDWGRNLVRVRGTKTVFRDRYVPITPLTAPLLHMAERFGPPFEPWPWVQGALRKLAVRLGIPHFSPKDLRRTHGQWLRAAGVDPHLIGRVLGHADSTMADRVYGQGDEVAIARLVQHAVSRTKDVRDDRTSARDAVRTGRKSRGK